MNPAGPPTEPPTSETAPPPSTPAPLAASAVLRRDLLSAYAASGAKVASWVVISAIVFRASPAHFAVLALVRGTLALLNYTTVGLTPALVHLIGSAAVRDTSRRVLPVEAEARDGVMHYARREPAESDDAARLRVIYTSGLAVAVAASLVGLLLVWLYAESIHNVHALPPRMPDLAVVALLMGIGVVLRLGSEAPSALLQTSGRIALDNGYLVATEVAWAAVTLAAYRATAGDANYLLFVTACAYAASGLLLLLARANEAHRVVPIRAAHFRLVDGATVRRLLGFGSVVAAAQLADFLYAPVDYMIINRLIDPNAVAAYAPVVQVNGGLLLLVGGLSAVVLPRAAVAHAAGDTDALRRYYVRGTLAAGGMLALASVTIWLLAPRIFRLWLGDPLPAAQAVLPLVLVHTVLGGSGGVGRSVLLAVGKAKPYAAAVLITGVSHVVLSYAFVRYLGWGLQGVALGTVAAAVGLCVAWQPWYVMRTLREMKRNVERDSSGRVLDAGPLKTGAAPPAAPVAPSGPPVEPL